MSEKSAPQQGEARLQPTQHTQAADVAEEAQAATPFVGAGQSFDAPAENPTAAGLQRIRLQGLQQLRGNAHVQRLLQRQGAPAIQRDNEGASATAAPTAAAPTATVAAPAAAPPTPEDVANDYEAYAQGFFVDNMDMELRTAAGTEGAAIGRRAASHAGQLVRDTCEPFERDQEIDTLILNTVFSVAGGGSSVAEANSSGTGSSRGANVGSRVVRMGLGIVQTWMPTLAGYRTVGQLKDAAVRRMGEAAEHAGETSSGSFQDYENAVMEALRQEWNADIARQKSQLIAAGHAAPGLAAFARNLIPAERSRYLDRLRNEYGSRSSHAESMISQITSMLRPRLDQLRTNLEEAKASRQRWQALGAVGAGIAGGAAIGAGIGVWGAGVGAVPGAIIGGVVGGVVGIGAAIGILAN